MTKFLVQSVEHAKKKDGAAYLKMILFEVGGKSHESVCWEDKEIETGVVIDATGTHGQYRGKPQLNVTQFRETADDPAAFLPRSKYDVDLMWDELMSFVAVVMDQDIKKLLELALRDPRWKRAPAAKNMHQAYVGGLLEHVLGLCRSGHAIAGLYPSLREDLMIAAAILHDIGKLDELDCSSFDYTDAGSLIGHISLGYQKVSKMMDFLETPSVDSFGVSTGNRLLLEHIILSHHMKKDWGSPVVPMILEAVVFHYLDNIDAKMAALTTEIEKSEGKTWTDWNKSIEQRVFIGKVDVA